MPRTKQEVMCTLFNCDHRHGNYCCYYCDKQCSNRCLNNPDACKSTNDKDENNGNYLK